MKTIATQVQVPLLGTIVNAGAGLLLNFFQKFKSGDFIEINGSIGAVTSQSLTKSQIKTVDGEIINVDNSAFFLGSMHNLSKQNIIRLDLNIEVCYTENMPKIKDSILAFLKSQKGLLSSPKIKISVTKLKDQFVELRISPWCALDNFLSLDSELESLLRGHLIETGFKLNNVESFTDLREIA